MGETRECTDRGADETMDGAVRRKNRIIRQIDYAMYADDLPLGKVSHEEHSDKGICVQSLRRSAVFLLPVRTHGKLWV